MPVTMEFEQEKIYVAVGKDVQEGMGTLGWALKNWSSQSISIVILHVNTSSNDFVKTPFGRLPVSTVSDEKLEVFRKYGQEKTDKLLSKYKAFCGKVRAEVLKIEKSEEPIHEVIVELILRLHMTKLVMGIRCMKSSSRKAKSGISAPFCVQKHKPDFCELFIICGGRLVSLRDVSTEGYIGADEELVVDDTRKKMKEKGSLRGWIGRILPNYGTSSMASNSETGSPHPQLCEDSEKWENCAEEIENYMRWLNLNSPNEEVGEEESPPQLSPMEQIERKEIDAKMGTAQKIEVLKVMIEDAKKIAEEKRNEAKISLERSRKAEWAISVCDRQAQELKSKANEQMARQIDLKMELDSIREQTEEASNDVSENQNRLKSALELEGELRDILQANNSERARIEAHLENVVIARGEVLREIEELRRQRDVLHRRMNFCREKEEIIMSNRLSYGYREFTVDELREATDDFSDRMRIKDGPKGVVYKGRLNHTLVAIKVQVAWSRLSQEEFQAKVNLIRQIRHPHILTVLGACTDQRALICEYAHHRTLHELLFLNPNTSSSSSRRRSTSSSAKNPRSRRKRPAVLLPWHARVRIAAEICSALAFLHAASTAHGRLRPSNVLLDRNLCAKIADFESTIGGERDLDLEKRKDVCDLGRLMLQLLTGREEVEGERRVLVGEADERAGDWPVEVAVGFGVVGARCAHDSGGWGGEGMAGVVREMDELKRMALAASGENLDARHCVARDQMDASDLPAAFLCPILQEMMKQPYIAADGFSYEREAIEEWVRSGHDTSPMTNLKLQHTRLIPNLTLRSLIHEYCLHHNSS